jgi:hypothetical protein
LIFPNSNASETNVPKCKRKIIPAVVLSEKYREYYQNELDKKLLLKSKKKQKSTPVAESSDSDVSVTYNDEDLDVSDIENLNLTVGRYVIHKYENTYYPGECVVLKKICCIFFKSRY